MKKNDIVQLTDKQSCAGLAWRGRRDKFVIKIAIINVNKGLPGAPLKIPRSVELSPIAKVPFAAQQLMVLDRCSVAKKIAFQFHKSGFALSVTIYGASCCNQLLQKCYRNGLLQVISFIVSHHRQKHPFRLQFAGWGTFSNPSLGKQMDQSKKAFTKYPL